MITNVGMKYKLHQVLFNQQISPNQPSSGLSAAVFKFSAFPNWCFSIVKQSGLQQRAWLHKLF